MLCGCAMGPSYTASPGQPASLVYGNPILVPVTDAQYVWENVVDVMDDYFKIEREEPVRQIGNTITEGRIDTFAEVSPTIFEPWRRDTADPEQFIENTFQSIRRKAVVRVIPTGGGYWIEVTVLKELEDVVRPEQATAGAATLRYDNTLTRVINPLGGPDVSRGWIPQGRDTALEQMILGNIQSRLACAARQPRAMPAAPSYPRAAAVNPPGAAPYLVQSPLNPEISSNTQESVSPPLYTQGDVALPEQQEYHFPLIKEFLHDSYLDYQNFYSFRGMAMLGIGLGTAAVLANTSLDQNFQNWYQNDVRSQGTNDFASVAKQFGNGNIFIPVYAGATLLKPYIETTPIGSAVGQWGDRCLRSVVVGGPPVLVLQWFLGGSRPTDAEGNSHWKPFNDNNAVSGHAFIGAVTFVNAAKMTDNPGVKLMWYTLSTLPGWSRINDNDHYLSQVILGWFIGYLAATAVDDTELCKHQFVVVPMVSNAGMGVGLMRQW
jgi:membrane-associated phospholipid phosphatase